MSTLSTRQHPNGRNHEPGIALEKAEDKHNAPHHTRKADDARMSELHMRCFLRLRVNAIDCEGFKHIRF